MPSKDKLKIAYNSQVQTSKAKGIGWELTFDSWLGWWQATGKFHLRGKKRGCFQMCRKGDVGPYSLDNIYCDRVEENSALPTRGKVRPGRACLLTSFALSGKAKEIDHRHSLASSKLNGKRYSTPGGIFSTSRECEQATGIKAATIMWRCKNSYLNQWGYA